MKNLLPLLLLLPLLTYASIYQDNSGLDRNNPGNWTFVSNLNSVRDNVSGNGDNWLGQNQGHFAKVAYGQDTGLTVNEGFTGIYRTDSVSEMWMQYEFTAGGAITQQDWITKGTVWRDTTSSGSATRLTFFVSVDKGLGFGSFQQVDTSDYFGDSLLSGVVHEMSVGAGNNPYSYDGPEATYSTDLSSLNILSGDTVRYRFTMEANDSIGGGAAQNMGLGVQLIPEPGVVGLLGVGFIMVMVYRRRKS
jgi:hypothetical protein